MLTNTFSYKKPLSHKPTPEQAHRGFRLMTLALIYDDKVKKCQTNCSVQRTLAILPNIRISRSLRFTFIFISGRVPRSFSHHCVSKGGKRPLDNAISYKESSQIIYKTFFRKMLTKRLRSGNFNTDKILALKLNEC